LALGNWNEHAWTGGGKDYREWLVTLPYYPAGYFSNHFDVRNVLGHIRCDQRDAPDGEKVLLIHEIQSDWTNSIRDAVERRGVDLKRLEDQDQLPPFWRQWSYLSMNLVCCLPRRRCHGLDIASTVTKGLVGRA
jgi:hypothetical protein